LTFWAPWTDAELSKNQSLKVFATELAHVNFVLFAQFFHFHHRWEFGIPEIFTIIIDVGKSLAHVRHPEIKQKVIPYVNS
jgi:hypothetical protein